MAGNTPHEAVANFRIPFRRVLSCVTDGIFNAPHPRGKTNKVYKANLNGGVPALLGNGPYSLQLGMSYEVIRAADERGHWRVCTREYAYTIFDENGERFAGWHWHPLETPDQTFPHMHSYEAAHSELRLPTGRVALEYIAMFALRELKVEPRIPNAEATILEALEEFEQLRTWS